MEIMGINTNQAGVLLAAGGGAVAASSIVNDARGTPFELVGNIGPAPARAVFGGLTAVTGIGLFACTFLLFNFLSIKAKEKKK